MHKMPNGQQSEPLTKEKIKLRCCYGKITGRYRVKIGINNQLVVKCKYI
jgi:hypothetical protein